jgi:uncharacterized protein YcgI (DUF1989 family)
MAEGAPYWMLWEELVVGGAHWSGLLRRGTTMRLTDVAGGGNVAALFYNYEDRLERYDMADTLKLQHTAYLTRSCVCYSDMGRILCSITDDTCGWHDTLCGLDDADGFLIELGKYGLGKRDLAANINFFSKVTTDADGSLKFHAGHSKPGAFVDLRFEMNTLVVLAASRHPLDASTDPLKDIRLTTWHSRPAPRNDPCRTRCPENERGFRNTEVWCR